jgi:hypothetical protein
MQRGGFGIETPSVNPRCIAWMLTKETKMKKQREYWKELTWKQWAIVLYGCIPGVLIFKSYLATLIYVVQMFTH